MQAPSDPQSLNRYSYCRNSPLVYTDVTGHFFAFIFAIIAAVIAHAAIPATVAVAVKVAAVAAVAVATYTFASGIEQGQSPGTALGRAALAGLGTFAGGVAGGAIGGAIGSSWVGFGAAVGAGAAGGASSAAALGGDPWKGAAAGAAAGAIGGAFSGIGGNLGTFGNIARAGAVGAAAGAAAGAIAGDPAQGALVGGGSALVMATISAIANGDFQRASDIGQKRGGALGKTVAEAEISSSATRKGLVDATGQALDAWTTGTQKANYNRDYSALIPMLSKSIPKGQVVTYNIFVNRVTGHITNALPVGTHDVRAYLGVRAGEAYMKAVQIYGTGEPELFFERNDGIPRFRKMR